MFVPQLLLLLQQDAMVAIDDDKCGLPLNSSYYKQWVPHLEAATRIRDKSW